MSAATVATCRPCVSSSRSAAFGNGLKGLRPVAPAAAVRASSRVVRVRAENEKAQVIKPLNGDPFIGMLETPVTSAPIVANYLSNLPAYRTGVAPVLRGVEIGLAHGFLVAGPFIKLGPLRNTDAGIVSGCLSAAGLVAILTVCLTIYGAATFQGDGPEVGLKTLTGREIARDPLQSSEGWGSFSSGFFVGGLSGVAWAYICTQILPFYS
uniref:Photosystem I reaction center subunit XI, chloroplastic n=1 Tax=Tetraselmis sp. GSL018 TaxID=582737 RepID=A0A061SCY8_9CHLO|mmetsp:Transcript_41374/g.98096  ORF Transcript_41374/g.98096 Transcript_41374/m.98096 type:complete len:210 (+) Transcript_41374:136-765(+)|eukprot:CAMPEP_0177585164 /NCGR_PEP_ID=MMETSP0419_2-20121207/4317_1 /TAXON_ID=582737 /ORGANISM="Tetraselmis sp., Strain GSL018" /LENGTH=209 /DNA_ID=CAMNT_0019074819 /DNA_START=79 /DNA_END=708 /DNA_ORIENTATION=-